MVKTAFTDSVGRTAWKDDSGKVYTGGGENATGYSVSQWNQRQSGERNKKSQEDYWDKYNEAVVASERKKAEKEAAEAKAEADKAKAEAAASEVEKGVLLDIININYH